MERRAKWGAEKKGRREGVERTTSIPSQPPAPPSPLQPHRCLSAHFSLRCPHYFGHAHTKVGEPGLSIKSPPPLQAHRCFSANFSLRCPHYYGPLYMKVGEPGLSIKSRIFIWSRLHDRWGDHMRDYMERRVTSPTWGPLYLRVNTPFKAWSRLCS